MKSLYTFITATMVGITLVVSGCGSVGAGKPSNQTGLANNVTGSKSANRTPAANATAPKTQTPESVDSFRMSPSQLANYDEVHGGPEPFAGTDVKRVPVNEALSIIPNGYPLKPGHAKFVSGDDLILDAWTGDLNHKPFNLTIYKSKQTGDIVVGIQYNGKVQAASLIKSHKYVIKNFTGRFVVLGVPYIEGPFYAYDLTTGDIVNRGKVVDQMSGDFPVQGAGGPLWIQGLDKKYPFQQ